MDKARIFHSGFVKLNYAGFVILMACILGGGTEQSLWTDHIIQIFMIPSILIGVPRFFDNHLGSLARLLIVGIVLLLLIQFLPYAPTRALPEFTGMDATGLWSASPAASLNAVLFTMCLIGFALYIATFDEIQQVQLIKFLQLGLLINILIGVVQLSFSGSTRIAGVFPFDITAGLFANENHLSALVFMMLPLFAWQFLARRNLPPVYVIIAVLITGFLFAVGSRAGMAISLGIAVFSGLWFFVSPRRWGFKLAILILAMGGMIYAFASGGFNQALDGDLRLVFYKNTMEAIADHWLTGTGLGTFQTVYPFYESGSEVIQVYANHAHNDYLELLLETGIFSVPVLLLFGLLVLRALIGSTIQQAAAFSILAVLVHSTVDYPLRTMAIAVPFAVLSTIMVLRRTPRPMSTQNLARQSQQASNETTTTVVVASLP